MVALLLTPVGKNRLGALLVTVGGLIRVDSGRSKLDSAPLTTAYLSGFRVGRNIVTISGLITVGGLSLVVLLG